MKINDRIIAFTRVPARDLKPNPRNWRTHPPRQREALRGLLAEIGYADALLVRELPTGDLQLIDGHLRAETTPEAVVPVLVLDLNDDEADKLLAALDPLAALAERDDEKLAELIGDADTSSPALRRFFDEILRDIETDKEADKKPADNKDTSDEIDIPDVHQVVVECASEAEQCALYQRLVDEGYTVRVISL